MKFDCGETREERDMRLGNWHPFFAIWPRKVADHDCRWLEAIERKGHYDSWVGWYWQYRAKSQPTGENVAMPQDMGGMNEYRSR